MASLFQTTTPFKFIVDQQRYTSKLFPSLKIQQKSKEVKKHKKVSKTKKKARAKLGMNTGQWTIFQNFKYKTFLARNATKMAQEITRRKKKIFVHMEKWIKTRTAQQCRSHHQKSMQKFQTIENTIAYFEEVEKDYQQQLEAERQKKELIKKQEQSFEAKLQLNQYMLSYEGNKLMISLQDKLIKSWNSQI